MADKIQDCYRTLDLDATASRDEVKQAWLEFQQFYHPDRHQHDQKLMRSGQEKLKKINAAYDTLKQHFVSVDCHQATIEPQPASHSTKSEPESSTNHSENQDDGESRGLFGALKNEWKKASACKKVMWAVLAFFVILISWFIYASKKQSEREK
jgi:hypothetical protein